MGWDAFILGELAFPDGAVARWREVPAVAARVAWPQMIAQGLIEPDEGEEPEVSTVAEALALSAKLNHYFGAIEVAGHAVRIAFQVDNSNYWMVCEPVVQVVSAAATVGAKGSVRFMDAGDAIALGHFTGALATVGGGKVVAEERDEPLAAEVRDTIRASVERAIAAAKAAAEARAAAKPKATPKPKAKPKRRAKSKAKPKAKAKRR